MATKKGGLTVSLVSMSQAARDVKVPASGTLRSALLASGFDEGSLDSLMEGVRVNGFESELGQRLKSGDLITVSPKVQGGSVSAWLV